MTNENIPIASFDPDQKDLDVKQVEHEKTLAFDLGGTVGIPYAAGSVKVSKSDVQRVTKEEPAVVINGAWSQWSGEDSIRWHMKASPTNSQGLCNPLYVQVSIQMTREVKARLWLSCQFKGEGLLNRMSRSKTHQPPHQVGSDPIEILLVGMNESSKISGDSLPLAVPGALDHDNQPGPKTDLEVYYWHYAFIAFCVYVYFTHFH